MFVSLHPPELCERCQPHRIDAYPSATCAHPSENPSPNRPSSSAVAALPSGTRARRRDRAHPRTVPGPHTAALSSQAHRSTGAPEMRVLLYAALAQYEDEHGAFDELLSLM